MIDEITTDEVTGAGFDKKKAEETITSFRTFIDENRDELTALQILYNQPQGRQRLTYAAIRELVQRLTDPPHYLTTANVWQAYKRLDAAKVRGAPVDEQLTEVVSLVRFALGQSEVLEPFSASSNSGSTCGWGGRSGRAANTRPSRRTGCAPSRRLLPPMPRSPRATFRKCQALPTRVGYCRRARYWGRG